VAIANYHRNVRRAETLIDGPFDAASHTRMYPLAFALRRQNDPADGWTTTL